jgi:hypothetical protein
MLEAFAGLGLIALIDEATGFEKLRAPGELQARFDVLLGDLLRPYGKEFHQRFWEALHALDRREGPWWEHPPYYGHLLRAIIYEPIAPGLADYLAVHRPPSIPGRRWHQWLKTETGLQALRRQIDFVTFLARSCNSLQELVDRVRLAAELPHAQQLLDLRTPRVEARS